MRRSLTVAALTAALFSASIGTAAADEHRRARPGAPTTPPGLYQSEKITCVTEYPNGVPTPVCTEQGRPDEAETPATGPINRFESGGGN